MINLDAFYVSLEKILLDARSYEEIDQVGMGMPSKIYYTTYLKNYESDPNKNYAATTLLIKNEEEKIINWIEELNFKFEWCQLSAREQDKFICFSPATHYALRKHLNLENFKLNFRACYANTLLAFNEKEFMGFIQRELNLTVSRPLNEAQTSKLKHAVEAAIKEDFPLYTFKINLAADDWFLELACLAILKKFELKELNKGLTEINKETSISVLACLKMLNYVRFSKELFLMGRYLGNELIFHNQFEQEVGRNLDIEKERKRLDSTIPQNSTLPSSYKDIKI